MFNISDEIFQLIQTIGVIVSFLLSFFAFLHSIRITKVNNGLLIAQHHRELWLEYCGNEKYKRLLEKNINFDKEPLTDQEKQFTNMIFIHMSESLSAIKNKSAYKIEGIKADVSEMLSYPIPMIVWQEYKGYHDKILVDFIEDIIKENSLKKDYNTSNTKNSHHNPTNNYNVLIFFVIVISILNIFINKHIKRNHVNF